MKAYVAITGTLFGLITLAHLWRIYEEGAHVGREPWFIGLTLLAGAFCVWAGTLLRRSARP